MKNSESSICLKTIENLQEIDNNNFDTTIAQDKIHYRRKRINELRLRGYTNQQISQKTGFNLSTIEKDLHAIRENAKQWYESESVTDYCQSLQDAVILYDCGIEELQLLYKEEESNQVRISIWNKILEFTEKKTKILEKAHSVIAYLQSRHVEIGEKNE